MPIPVFIYLAGTSLLALTGIKKGLDAKNKNSKAQKIIKNAQRRFENAKEELENERIVFNKDLENYAKFKLKIFTNQIRNLLKVLKCQKRSKSNLNLEVLFTNKQIKDLQVTVDNSYEILTGLAEGMLSGSLVAIGSYGMVGLLAEASTGTAIANLSGVAATNATLAWLGGGSLATGGLGVAGGMAVLSGLVAGPAIAVTGFVMDSKAEDNLTKAINLEAEIDEKIEKIRLSIEGFEIIRQRINEITTVLNRYIYNFDNLYIEIINQNNICKDTKKIERLLLLGKAIKNILEINLIDENGNENKDSLLELKRITQKYYLEE